MLEATKGNQSNFDPITDKQIAMNSQEYQDLVPAFYKYQMWTFKFYGLLRLSPNTSRNFRIIHTIYFWHIVLFWVLLSESTFFIQFISNITHINEVIKVFFMFATTMAVIAKFTSIKMNNRQYEELVESLHQQPMFRPQNPSEVKLFMESVKTSRGVRNSYCFLSLCSLNIVLWSQYIVDNTQLPLSAYVPFDLDVKWRYILMYLYQYFAISLCCYINIAFDSISASVLIFTMAQLDILSDRIRHLDERSQGEDNEAIYLKLQNCILNHGEILKLAESIENLVKFPISVQVFCSILVLIANFYAMSFLSKPGDYVSFIKFLIYQLCMLSQIFILCFYSNEVTLKSSRLSYELFCVNWINWNRSNRKLLLLMMQQFDTPIRIRGIIKNYSFNLASFTSIVNSSYSYFALLKNINS